MAREDGKNALPVNSIRIIREAMVPCECRCFFCSINPAARVMPAMKNASVLLPGVRLTTVNQRDQN